MIWTANQIWSEFSAPTLEMLKLTQTVVYIGHSKLWYKTKENHWIDEKQ